MLGFEVLGTQGTIAYLFAVCEYIGYSILGGGDMATVKVDEKELQALISDAERYRYLRDEDNWGEDSGEDCWERLGESTCVDFDDIVDIRMASRDLRGSYEDGEWIASSQSC